MSKEFVLFFSMFWLFEVLFSLFGGYGVDPTPNPMIKVPRQGVSQQASQH